MKKIIIGLCALLLGANVAAAETTDWLQGSAALAYGNKMDRQGYTLTGMKCRDTDRVGLNVRTFDYKLTFQKTKEATQFLWAVGSVYGLYETRANKEGYTRVSYDQFRRARTGLLVRCGVWHKK